MSTVKPAIGSFVKIRVSITSPEVDRSAIDPQQMTHTQDKTATANPGTAIADEYATDDEAPGKSVVHSEFNVSIAEVLRRSKIRGATATHTER